MSAAAWEGMAKVLEPFVDTPEAAAKSWASGPGATRHPVVRPGEPAAQRQHRGAIEQPLPVEAGAELAAPTVATTALVVALMMETVLLKLLVTSARVCRD